MKMSSIIAPLLVAALAAPAVAQNGLEAASKPVRYSDLDLGAPADRAALRLRVQHAAAELCGTPSLADPKGQREVRRCREQAARNALGQIERAIAAASRPTVVALGE